MFKSFDIFDIETDHFFGGTTIHGVTGGSGPPLLLLHGYPQTHVMWHKIAAGLSEHFCVVAVDLRGYGESGKPTTTADHSPYSKRAMAADLIDVMSTLGHDQFLLAGHDRGGRVAHRLAIDHPKAVSKLAVLDIAPTREMYQLTDDAFARAYWHWFFLIQPHPFPEKLINHDPDAYFKHKVGAGRAGLKPFSAEAMDSYLNAFRNPATVHASCEDYRAAATIDIQHDNADDNKKIDCPLLVIWGETGVIEACFDPLELWSRRANNVSGFSLPGGHYLAEELPDTTLTSLSSFFLGDA